MNTDVQLRETVEMLYGKHFDSMHRIAWRCLNDRNMVRGVIQEIFTRLMANNNSFVTLEDAERHLFSSFKNMLIDRARQRSGWQYVELDEAGGKLPIPKPARKNR